MEKNSCVVELRGVSIYHTDGEAVRPNKEDELVLSDVNLRVEAGEIEKDACIMLNITGAGEETAKQNRELFHLKPSKVFSLNAEVDDVVTYVESLF